MLGILKNHIMCINSGFNKDNELVPILMFSVEGCLKNYVDVYLIHEINHAIELSRVDDEHFKTGFELFNKEEEGDREYMQLSENINQRIAMHITKLMHEAGVYLFDNPKTAKIEGGTSYEGQNIFTNEFYENFKDEIIFSRLNNSLESLYDVVGKDNFDALNNNINEYKKLPYYEMMDDVINKRNTKNTQKRSQLYYDTHELVGKMLIHKQEYYEQLNRKAI